jgi:hypothetical protein
VHDIRNAGLLIFGFTILTLALYSLYYALRESDMKSRINGLVGFLCFGFVGIIVIGLAMQLWGRKC